MELEAHIEEKKHSFEKETKPIGKNKKKRKNIGKINPLNYEDYDIEEENF